MTTYTAAIEVAKNDTLTTDQIDHIIDQLEDYHPSISTSPRGWLAARITLPGETLAQATKTAITLIEAAYGAPAITCEIMTETEADAREGWDTIPELISVSEAAELLGITRQAVTLRIQNHTLPATKIGNGWAIPRAALNLDN
ncbi:MAG: excisionase family DNA-binding protein [Actinobacteria bacterium]|nr:excisionase family DNA-binding protein [Actinomycetota bacterium]